MFYRDARDTSFDDSVNPQSGEWRHHILVVGMLVGKIRKNILWFLVHSGCLEVRKMHSAQNAQNLPLNSLCIALIDRQRHFPHIIPYNERNGRFYEICF